MGRAAFRPIFCRALVVNKCCKRLAGGLLGIGSGCPPIVPPFTFSSRSRKMARIPRADRPRFWTISLPVPARQVTDPEALGLPLNTQTFGVINRAADPKIGALPDQANRRTAAVYEASLTTLLVLKRGK
jgi:hypothetical protein